MPLCLILRNRLKYALTRKEVQMITMRRHVEIDGKIRTDVNYPCGLMDVIRFDKTNESFRLLFDVKGRFTLHLLKDEESGYKLCRVQKIGKAKKASIGTNPFVNGQAGAIPYVVTHDGRTIRYPDPDVRVNDTIKFDLESGKITEFIKFDVGNLAMITRGANAGRIGVIHNIERHPGGFDIVHLRDAKGHPFATRLGNVFCVGQGKSAWISLPRGRGIRKTIEEERDARQKKKE